MNYMGSGGPGRTRIWEQGIMSPQISLFMGYQAEEPQTLFRWLFRLPTETEPIPNLVVGHSERDAGKLKMRKSLWKPNTELPPNRNSEISTGDSALSTAGVITDGFPECRIRK